MQQAKVERGKAGGGERRIQTQKRRENGNSPADFTRPCRNASKEEAPSSTRLPGMCREAQIFLVSGREARISMSHLSHFFILLFYCVCLYVLIGMSLRLPTLQHTYITHTDAEPAAWPYWPQQFGDGWSYPSSSSSD